MKKLLLLAAIFTLVFTSCPTDEDAVNSKIFGVWTANYGTDNKDVLSLNIASKKTWTLAFTDRDNVLLDGTWSGSGNSITLKGSDYRYRDRIGSATLSKDKLILNQNFSTSYGRPVTITLTKSGSSGDTLGSTTLKIKNESSKTIADVLWNNVFFKDDSGGENADIYGTWAGSYEATNSHSAGELEFEIGRTTNTNYSGAWSLLYKDSNGDRGTAYGTFKRDNNNLTIYGTSGYANATASLSANKLTITISGSTGNPSLTSRFGDIYELTRIGDPFKPGTNVTKGVEAGSGYIFFKVGTTAYRTKDLVVVEKDNEAEFTFNDYTLVVNVISPDNTVTLGSL